MQNIAYVAIWLLVTVWAVWFISRRVADRRTRIVYYLLIWLVPFVGVAAAILILGFFGDRKPTDSNARMFDEVVDARRKERPLE